MDINDNTIGVEERDCDCILIKCRNIDDGMLLKEILIHNQEVVDNLKEFAELVSGTWEQNELKEKLQSILNSK